MLDSGYVVKGTRVWDGIHTTLMLARGATGQRGMYVRHPRHRRR